MAASHAILAAAGSRKTERIVEAALSVERGRVLITTFTNENQNQILRRIERKVGVLPAHISVSGWFSFLITECAKPYQRAVTGRPFSIAGLNFKGRRMAFAKKADANYFLDKEGNLYRDGVSHFVFEANARTGGAVIARLERMYSHILVDEVQDLVGYDLEVLDLLLGSRIPLLLVGDPRQHTLSTNLGPKNKKFQGAGLADWFARRAAVCKLEILDCSYRCNQAICDFADSVFPSMPKTRSVDVGVTGHDGVFEVARTDVADYLKRYPGVVVLRHSKAVDTAGLKAMNIGVAKGSTFDRVLIFPTKPMLRFLRDRDASKLDAPERLYVAVTRARFSVAFVVPDS